MLLIHKSRYLVERSEWKAAEPLMQMTLRICEAHFDHLSKLLATITFELTKFGSWTNMPAQQVYDYSIRHYEICRALQDDSLDDGMRMTSAKFNLSMACMLIDRYEEAIEHCLLSENLDKKHPENLADKEWPHFARIYRAWALAELDRYDEAVAILMKTINWRLATYDLDDTQSVK